MLLYLTSSSEFENNLEGEFGALVIGMQSDSMANLPNIYIHAWGKHKVLLVIQMSWKKP